MINKLDSLTIDKIAAGEVIDRPASAVKELLENAIDAGSSIINVSIKNGGKSEIIVQDNGKGIDYKELPLAATRHATSKISSFEDLEKIYSLGFRGEALASIAAVAKLEIISKEHDKPCYTYQINGGKEYAYEECAGIDGTKVIVKDLFYNVPVRQKFLKSHVTESNHIGKKVQNIALSHPNISFTYTVDGKEKIHTSGSGDLTKLIYEVFGRYMTEDGKIIDEKENNIHVYGFLGSPSIGRGNHNYELTFVNKRMVENSTIFHAIEEGYSGFLMEHKYPFVLLYIEVDPSDVDVNVHPTKSDIKLVKAREIHDFISRIIEKNLNSNLMIHEVAFDSNALKAKRLDTYNYFYDRFKSNSESLANENKTKSMTDVFIDLMKERVSKKYEDVTNENNESVNINDLSNSKDNIKVNKIDDSGIQLDLSIANPSMIDKEIKVIGQIFNTYWIVEYDKELLIIDQHAAHEKVLYERFLKEYETKSLLVQVVNPPIMISLPIEERNYVDTYADIFKIYGFEIESIGEKDYLLRGVPYELEELGSKEAFQEFIDDLFNGSAITPTPRKLKDKIAMCACKAAVKGNNRLNDLEIKNLLKEMMNLDNPYNCPHGRPTMIRMTKKEIEKHFGRIV